MNKIIGLVLIVVGIIGIAWGGFSYKTRHKDIDSGPIQASHEQTHHVPLSPIAGGLALLGGVALLMAGDKG